MSILVTVLASITGLFLGFAAATLLGSKARSLLVDKLQGEKVNALKDSTKEIGSLKHQVKQLEAGQKKGGKGKNNKDDSAKQLSKLEKEIKSLNNDINQGVKKAKKTADSHAAALATLQQQVNASKSAADNAAKSVKKVPVQGEDLSGLETNLKKAGLNLDSILNALMDHQGQKAVLLSDATGIVIASAGDADTIENIAAASGTLTGIPKALNKVLPLGQYFSFQLQDGDNAISGQTFESDEELVALTTIGSTSSSVPSISKTIKSIETALE